MFKILLKLSFIILLSSLTVACSGITEKTLDYNEAKSMRGYGYITMDFSQANEVEYGRCSGSRLKTPMLAFIFSCSLSPFPCSQ